MMAFDRTPGKPSLDAATVAELRTVLSSSLTSGSHGAELKALLARVTADAKDRGVLAEQLLVALKDVWYTLPQMSSPLNSEVQSRLMQELIALSISEYYRS